MKITEEIAYKIWKIREDLDMPGNNEHDWEMAEGFLQQCNDQYDDDDIYVWFIQLDENMVEREYQGD